MSTIVELTTKYESNFARGVLSLARGNYQKAKSYLKLAAHTLNELSIKRSGESRFCTQEWLFDIVKEIDGIEQQIAREQSKEKGKKVKDKSSLKVDENSSVQKPDSRFMAEIEPTTTFADIAGLDDVKETVLFKAIYPQKYPELYQKLKKRTGGGILLYGLPGTGKTLIAEAIAHETGATFFSIKCSDLGSKWFGETEQNIRDVFQSARDAGNAVIFFDEIEAYASNRRENSAMERAIPEFLSQMQGVGESNKQSRILVIAATNKPWRLDGAFLRPGRFDDKIYVPLPDEPARLKIILDRMRDVPMEADIDFDYLARVTEGYNGADMDYLCEKAKELALQRLIRDHDTNEMVTKGDFYIAIQYVKSSVLDADRQEMEHWIQHNNT